MQLNQYLKKIINQPWDPICIRVGYHGFTVGHPLAFHRLSLGIPRPPVGAQWQYHGISWEVAHLHKGIQRPKSMIKTAKMGIK